MFDIPVTYQLAIVAAVLVGLAIWLVVFAGAERSGRRSADPGVRQRRPPRSSPRP